MPCGGQVFQICCSAERSLDILQTSKALHTRKRVLPKYVGGARLVRHYKSGTPRISKGPRPFCFRKSPEKTLLKGFLWATSSRRLDTALLCAAKKRGVELNQLAGLCQTKLALGATDGSKKSLLRLATEKERTPMAEFLSMSSATRMSIIRRLDTRSSRVFWSPTATRSASSLSRTGKIPIPSPSWASPGSAFWSAAATWTRW